MKRGLIILTILVILFLNMPNINASPADLNSDNKVNATDIQLIIRWILGLDQSNPATDMDNNGQVNIFDLVNASRLFGKIYGADSLAPTIISSSPSSNLSSGVTSTILFAKTDERATCKYLNTTGGNYSVNMTTFTRTGGVSHSTTLTGLANGTIYNYYIQCQDEAGNLNSTNYNISFGVNSSFAPPDIFDFGFEDGTFSTLVGSSGQSPTQVMPTDPWVIDSTTAAVGNKSAKHHVKVTTHSIINSTAGDPTTVYAPGHNITVGSYALPQIISPHSNAELDSWAHGQNLALATDADHFTMAGIGAGYTGGTGGVFTYNQGYGFFAPSFAAGPRYNPLYVRFAYMQSAGFDNSNPIKVCRMNGGATGYQNFGGVIHSGSGANTFQLSTDAGAGNMDVSNAANQAKANWIAMGSPTPNDLRGEWHWFEFYQEQVNSTHNNYKLWLDNILIIDFPNYSTGSTIALGEYWNGCFFGDTLNGIDTEGYYWFDEIGISTQRIGIPT